jgi:hypothetical protein
MFCMQQGLPAVQVIYFLFLQEQIKDIIITQPAAPQPPAFSAACRAGPAVQLSLLSVALYVLLGQGVQICVEKR